MEASAALSESRSVLFVCPTGGGKTFVFAELAWMFRQNHGRVLVLADREHLVGQAADVIDQRTGLSVGREQGKEHVDPQHLPDVVCATIQSMRRPGKLATFDPQSFALIVIDEADLGVAPSYAAVLSHFASARVFGCTATPDRADGKSLGSVFEKVITPLYMGDLITQGYLSPIRRTLVRIQSVTLDDVKTVDGDYSNADLERVLTHEKALHEVVRPSMELSGTRPSIVFAATVAHAEALADVFNRYAPKSAAVIHGKMPVKERRKILKAYERGKIRFLCSCALLLRGVDLPLTSCVIMARPTRSRALYCQAIGRGTRVANGKDDLLVLDFTDNSTNHALISAIDLMRPLPADVRERAREIADAQPEADPMAVIEQAERELAADPAMRERIKAKVSYNVKRVIDLDWDNVPLGTVPDLQLARELGVSDTLVYSERKKRNIPSCNRWRIVDVDWKKQRLGKRTDMEVAKELGCSRGTVKNARQRLGIPPLAPARGKPKNIDWGRVELGRIPDKEAAKKLGISAARVCIERNKLGIPPAVNRTSACAAGSVVPFDTMNLLELSKEFAGHPDANCKLVIAIDQGGTFSLLPTSFLANLSEAYDAVCKAEQDSVLRGQKIYLAKAIDKHGNQISFHVGNKKR
jgi:superfamily II DNA or RNA helicase